MTATGGPGLVSTKLSWLEFDIDSRHRSPSIVLKLEPEGTITGNVMDETGQPQAEVEVIAFRQYASGAATKLTAVSKATTDKSGVYLLNRLPPGNYYVGTPILKPNTLAPQNKKEPFDKFLLYSPSAISLEEAIATHIERGQNQSGIDIHLRPLTTFRIEGTAQLEMADQVSAGKLELCLHARDNSGVAAPGREIILNSDGSFQANVLPGLYTLRLIGATGHPSAARIENPALPNGSFARQTRN